MNTSFLQSKLLKNLSVTILFCIFFFIDASFRLREFDDKEVDFQVIIKLIVMALAVSIGSFTLLLKDFYKKQVFYFTFFIFIFFTAFWSINSLYTLSIGLSYTSYFLFITFFVKNYGVRLFVVTVSSSMFLFSMLSFILYIFVPEMGRYVLWINDVLAPTWRMSGLTTSANNFARICAAYIFLIFFFDKYVKEFFGLRYYKLQLLLAALGLLMSGSRTTIALMLLALAAYFFIKSEKVTKVYYLMTAVAVSMVLAILSPYILDVISRDGGNDFTSLTGRTLIWEAADYFIEQKPMLGYGFGSSIYLLPDFSDFLGFAPPHAHNMYLQLLISGGNVGLAFFLIVISYAMFSAIKQKSLFSMMFLAFVLAIGFFESGAVSLTSNTLTLFIFFVFNVVALKIKDVR